MFSKTSSVADEIESALIQNLPENPNSQLVSTLENLDRTAQELERQGWKEAAEQATLLLEKIAAGQVSNQREAALYYLQKALESLLKLPERKNPIFHNVLKQTTDLVQRAYLRVEGLKNLEESSKNLSEYEEEEGPATIRPSGIYEKEENTNPIQTTTKEIEAEQFWINALNKTAQEQFVHTIKFPPGAIDGVIAHSLQTAGVSHSQYQYNKNGSVVKFTPHQLRRFLKELQDFIDFINEPGNESFQAEGKDIKFVLELIEQEIKKDRGIAQAFNNSDQLNKFAAKKKSKKSNKNNKSKNQKIRKEVEKLRKLTPEQEVENLKNVGWVFEAPADCEMCQDHQEHMMLAHDHSCEHSHDLSMADDLRERGGVLVPLMGGEDVAPLNSMFADDYNWIKEKENLWENADKSLEEEPIEDYEPCGECGFDHAYEAAEAREAHRKMEIERVLEELEEEDELGVNDRHFSHFMDSGKIK